VQATDDSLKQRILRTLAAPKYRPLDKVELGKLLAGKGRARVDVSQALKELERAGEIARIRKNRYVLPAAADLVTGVLSVHQAGYAFLSREGSDEQDLFIAAENTGTAMHGDRVVARISRDEGYSRGRGGEGRQEGRVIRILERAHETMVGTLQQSRHFFYVVPDDPRLVHNIYVQVPPAVPLPKPPARGDKVVVQLDSWESRHLNPEGQIVEVLGRSGDPGVDVLSIIRKYHLPLEFPEQVVREAEQIPETVQQRMIEGREDLREQFIFTIDPDDARDFDDAIHVERLSGGGWNLGVHIADVAAYVQPGSALDKEALKRGNSVYLPDRVIPMLPERLSNGVCSLRPHVDRLAHSVFIQFSKDGRPRSHRFARTVIRSAQRLTYKQAYAILQQGPLSRGGAERQPLAIDVSDELRERLYTAWELASLLRRRRFQHGSLDLDFPEVKVRLDENGAPIAMERIENDESHQLIEEFMLAANEAVAVELKNRLIPAVYRVHEKPDPERLAEYRELVLSYDYKAGDLTQRTELQRLLASFRGKPEEQALKIGLLKSLKRARYAPQPLGHYGLAKTNYTHFTSPIRRYADLVVHRALASLSQPQSRGGDVGRLASLAEHISTTERNAAEAEIEAVKLKKLQFFELQLQAQNPQVFRASVIDVKNFGLLVELPEVLLTGMVHISSLNDDFYVYSAPQRKLIGRQTRRRFSVGDELQVHVARVDTFKRQVDFALAEERPQPGKQTQKHSRRKRR
jgi:ribonuclease R